MAKRKKDYEIGYGKPPKSTRFQEGRSGNPRGRPKGRRNFKTELRETLNEKVTINEGGRMSKISTQRAVLKRLREKALKGDNKAMDRLLNLATLIDQDETTASDGGTVSKEDQAIIQRYVDRKQLSDDTGEPKDDDDG